MFNGFRFNGAAFNSFGFAIGLQSDAREPDFRWLMVDAQDFTVRLAPQDFGIRVLPGGDRLTVPPRTKTITVRKD
jgi:hypothetical protein